MATTRKPMTFDVERSSPIPAPVQSPVATVRPPDSERQQVGARVTKVTYRQLKARAALQGVTVQALVEQAIVEFLAKNES